MSGAHTHDTSGEHIQNQIFYFLEARDYSRLVIYQYIGKDQFQVFTVNASTVPNPGNFLLTTDSLMLFKVPQGYEATFEITEVAVRAQQPDYQGRYLVTMQLHPFRGSLADLEKHATDMEKMHATMVRKGVEPVASDDDELGVCIAEPNNPDGCTGAYSPCRWGQVVRRIDKKCQCVDPQGGGG
jgi:hypothetical protein